MKLIVITRPDFFLEETESVIALFRNGLETLHLRKPGASENELKEWLRKIPATYYSRIVLHDQFQLTQSFPLKGIHLNRRNPQKPEGFIGQVSRSCHSLEEVEQYKEKYDYVFLSPIYDSISKEGYHAAFDYHDLCKARDQGIIDERVIALGGIDTTHLDEVKYLRFGGVALLGDVWNQPKENRVRHFRHLRYRTLGAPPVVLTIAGSDCSGGAGIQADIKTISALGAYAASVITNVTAQNTLGVQGIFPIAPQFMTLQVEAVWNDLWVQAVKVGMIGGEDMALALAAVLSKRKDCPVVYDPVMVSTSGHRLMEEGTIDIVCQNLLPLCTLITPNLHEACLLSGRSIETVKDMEQAASAMAEHYGVAVLIKGGHLEGNLMYDVLFDYHTQRFFHFTAPRIESRNLHGTGCTLSSAIATYLALGNGLEDAVEAAKSYVSQAIAAARDWELGEGHGPLCHFFA